MTIKEVLIIELKKQNIILTDDEINLALLKADLDGSTTYDTATNGMDTDLVFAGLLLEVIEVSELREDDVAIKFASSRKGLYSSIMRKWGLVDPFLALKPTVKQVNLW